MSDAALTPFLAGLPGQALGFALVLCRVSAMVMLAPGFGEQTYPMTVRAGIALALTILVLPLVPSAAQADLDPLGLGLRIAGEIFMGGLIGALAQLAAQALPIAGQIISLMTGLSNVLQPDPALGSEISAPSRLLSLLVPVLALVSGAWVLPVRAVIGSYALLPDGLGLLSAHGRLLGDGVQAMMRGVGAAFSLGLELAAPFVLMSVLWEIGLALLGRLVPNWQVYNVISPTQMLGGIAVLAVLIRPMIEIWQSRALDAFASLPGLG